MQSTIRLKVDRFSEFKEIISPETYIRNLAWTISATKVVQLDGEEAGQNSLSLSLGCGGLKAASSCRARCFLSIVPQKEDCLPITCELDHVFTSGTNSKACELPLDDILDPDRGFLKDDSIILEARVVAEAPHMMWA